MRTFELLGAAGDETRLLLERTTGYSVALPGHPRLAAIPAGQPTYDAIVVLDDVPVELGFRIDDVPATPIEPMALAASFATSYVKNRQATEIEPPRVDPCPASLRPASAVGGARAIYRLRDTANDPVMEQLYLVLRPAASGLHCLTHTTRFRNTELDVFEWAHLRAAIFDQHHWDTDHPRDRPSPIWPPESEIAICGARLQLTRAGWTEAADKAAAIGRLTDELGLAIVRVLMGIVQTFDPPRMRLNPIVFPVYVQRISAVAPAEVTPVLVHNLDRCLTTLDLRAWAKQCMWAIARQGAIAAQLGS